VTIETVDLAIENGGSVHSYVAVYERVSSNINKKGRLVLTVSLYQIQTPTMWVDIC
jgi:hypothetical protein